MWIAEGSDSIVQIVPTNYVKLALVFKGQVKYPNASMSPLPLILSPTFLLIVMPIDRDLRRISVDPSDP